MSLVVTNGLVVTMDAEERVIPGGAVAIDGADIVAVGTADEIGRQFRGAETIDAAGQVVAPGLVNTHTHAPMVLYRGLADDLALMDWLQKYIFPAEAKTVSPEFVRAGTRLAALEMIRSGTTTFADMYYFEEEIAQETKAAGLRGSAGPDGYPVSSGRCEDTTRGVGAGGCVHRGLQGRSTDHPSRGAARHVHVGRADPHGGAQSGAAPRGADADSPGRDARRDAVSPWSAARCHQWITSTGLGFLGAGVMAAHGVWVSEADIASLRTRGVGVSHNPESNMKLASGTAPVPAYLAAGVAVGLGTDGAASNNDLDMFEAMRMASLLHKLQSGDPRVVGARTALAMATIGGARALGMASEIGSLEPGKRADVIVVDMTAARQTPMYDPISHLVYTTRGDDVRTTIVHGRGPHARPHGLESRRGRRAPRRQTWADKVVRR